MKNLAEIGQMLRNGERVIVRDFGTFTVVDTPARKARNPATGETVDVPAGKKVKFRASKGLLG
jgi:DNA-binding protein HU-beta